MRDLARQRLKVILRKATVTGMSQQGPVELDAPADANAIAAVRALVAMDQMDQADDHLADKNKRLDEGKPTERLAGSVSDAEVVAFFLGIGAPEKMPAALLERYKAGEFRD